MKTALLLFTLVLAAPVLAQVSPKSGNTAENPLLKKFDTNGDGVIDDSERCAVRAKLREMQNKPGATTPSGKTETIGNREVTEMEYASSDGRKIPCVLSMPKGDGPFPMLVTIHGGQGNRDLGYIRTMAAPNKLSPTINAFNEQPWAILAISYRSGNGALFGMEHDDVIAGIRFAKTLSKVDAARVGVVGGSHGGHLALVAAEKMGREFLCVAVGSPWMTDPVVYMTGDPNEPPLSLVPQQAREELVKNGRTLFNNLTRGRGMSEQQAREFITRNSIEANADKIVVPSLFITSRGDDQAPHVLVEPTINRMKAAGQDVTVYTAEKSPHGFYWARTVSAARALRGEKSSEEKAEEEKARAIIIAFFTEQFARTGPKPVESPKVAAATSASVKPAENSTAKSTPESAPPGPRAGLATRGAGDGEPMTRGQFMERFSKSPALAGRPEVLDRLFGRLDENKDGKVDAEELKKLSTLRGQRGGASGEGSDPKKPTTPPETKSPATNDSKPTNSPEAKPSATPDTKSDSPNVTKPAADDTPTGSREPYVKKTLTPGQSGAIRKLRERMANIPVPENLSRRTLDVGGREREFFIHIPSMCKGKPSPVVFALHGGASSSGLAQHLKVDYTKFGEQEGYVTVYPSAVNGWNIGSHYAYSVKRRTSDADDVGFFRAMFDTLIAEGVADARRIYITGGSNGGVMTQFLVCHLADRIAGAGVMVATLPRAAARDWPKPSRPVPMLVMLGTVDPMKPWAGNSDQMSADETIAFWRKQNASTGDGKKWDLPDRDPNDGCRVHAERWEGKAPVLFYTMQGHGHGWPMQRGNDATGTGPKTRDISAPEEFWKFFESTSTSL